MTDETREQRGSRSQVVCHTQSDPYIQQRLEGIGIGNDDNVPQHSSLLDHKIREELAKIIRVNNYVSTESLQLLARIWQNSSKNPNSTTASVILDEVKIYQIFFDYTLPNHLTVRVYINLRPHDEEIEAYLVVDPDGNLQKQRHDQNDSISQENCPAQNKEETIYTEYKWIKHILQCLHVYDFPPDIDDDIFKCDEEDEYRSDLLQPPTLPKKNIIKPQTLEIIRELSRQLKPILGDNIPIAGLIAVTAGDMEAHCKVEENRDVKEHFEIEFKVDSAVKKNCLTITYTPHIPALALQSSKSPIQNVSNTLVIASAEESSTPRKSPSSSSTKKTAYEPKPYEKRERTQRRRARGLRVRAMLNAAQRHGLDQKNNHTDTTSERTTEGSERDCAVAGLQKQSFFVASPSNQTSSVRGGNPDDPVSQSTRRSR